MSWVAGTKMPHQEKLIDLFEEEDERKPLIAKELNWTFYTTKYSDLSTGTDKVIVIRASELYFIRMEAMAMMDSVGYASDIRNDLNRIRHRAGLPSITEEQSSSILNLIAKEKQLEFAFEGKRWVRPHPHKNEPLKKWQRYQKTIKCYFPFHKVKSFLTQTSESKTRMRGIDVICNSIIFETVNMDYEP